MKLPSRNTLTLTSLLLSSLTLTSASEGDRSHAHRACVHSCKLHSCTTKNFESTIPLSLWLTRWTCLDDCKYTCMHDIVDDYISSGRASSIPKFYGKWPLWRFAGMQEPASVFFSMGNFAVHWDGFRKVRRGVPGWHPMRTVYLVWASIGMNAWFWSSVFHTRDLPLTEKFDYFSAALLILSGLYVAILRVFHLYPRPQSNDPRTRWRTVQLLLQPWKILAALSIAVYGHYLYRVTSTNLSIDYAYNTLFDVSIAALHNAFWTVYFLPTPNCFLILFWPPRFPNSFKSYRPLFVNKVCFCVVSSMATTLLAAMCDSPPWKSRIFDAHSLWHASTIPIGMLWYTFLLDDSLDPSWKGFFELLPMN